LSEVKNVGQYFRDHARQFDSIYEGKTAFGRWLDRRFRSSIFIRYALTFEHSGDLTGKTALDIGCGPGRYAVEFARRGAARVLGVDISDEMVELATAGAREEGVADRCEFMLADMFSSPLDETFDIVVAMGVFDYVREPEALLVPMRRYAKQGGKVMASFPKWDLIRAPIRRWRYKIRNCPVYYYTWERTVQVLKNSGLDNHIIKDIPGRGQDWFVCCEV
jgi:2-polyprenyl-3-methyl-5-hydroxy-6-metoxy-1,4-benzoquinol methylase